MPFAPRPEDVIVGPQLLGVLRDIAALPGSRSRSSAAGRARRSSVSSPTCPGCCSPRSTAGGCAIAGAWRGVRSRARPRRSLESPRPAGGDRSPYTRRLGRAEDVVGVPPLPRGRAAASAPRSWSRPTPRRGVDRRASRVRAARGRRSDSRSAARGPEVGGGPVDARSGRPRASAPGARRRRHRRGHVQRAHARRRVGVGRHRAAAHDRGTLDTSAARRGRRPSSAGSWRAHRTSPATSPVLPAADRLARRALDPSRGVATSSARDVEPTAGSSLADDSRRVERRRNVGGLVSALEPVLAARDGMWLGWSGRTWSGGEPGPLEVDELSRAPLAWIDFPRRVARSLLQRLLQSRPLAASSTPSRAGSASATTSGRRYVQANRAFARPRASSSSRTCRSGSTTTTLLLVAAELRRLGHRGPIGLFLHIPFPASTCSR